MQVNYGKVPLLFAKFGKISKGKHWLTISEGKLKTVCTVQVFFIFQLELRADRAHWPSSMKNILVSSIFADELLVQIQYLKIINFLLKWSYWLRNSKISNFYKRNFVLREILTEIFFQIFVHKACLPKKTCVHGTLKMAPLNRASNAHEFCI